MRRFLLGVALVDVPVLIAVAVVGSVYGFAHTYEAVTAWRLAHPWSFLPSIALAALLAARWTRRREQPVTIRHRGTRIVLSLRYCCATWKRSYRSTRLRGLGCLARWSER